MILDDFTYSTTKPNGLKVNYYGYYATITSLLRVQCTLLREFVPLDKEIKLDPIGSWLSFYSCSVIFKKCDVK